MENNLIPFLSTVLVLGSPVSYRLQIFVSFSLYTIEGLDNPNFSLFDWTLINKYVSGSSSG